MAHTVQNSSHKAIERYISDVKLQGGILTYLPVVINNSLAVNGTLNSQTPIVDLTAATATVTSAQSGNTFLLDRAAGITVTLPAPTVGLSYTFVVVTSVTSNNYKIITNTSTVFVQGAITDASTVFVGDGTTDVAVTMNGSTTGGLKSTELTFTCLSLTLWQVLGTSVSSGTAATPFTTS